MRKRVCSFVVFTLLLIGNSFAFAQSPQINNGLFWLTSAQTSTGNWQEVDTSEYYSTAASLDAVYALEPSSPAYTNAFQWMTGQMVSPTDYLSRRIIALKRAGMDVSSELEVLLLYRNSNGGWGGETSYLSDNLDTALALQALKAANYSNTTIIYHALSYLTANQKADGGWVFSANDASNTYITSIVLRTLTTYNSVFINQDSINLAAAFLLAKQAQNNDGGFGSSPSTVYETALSLMALVESGQGNGQDLILPLQNAINYLTTTQLANGSWNDDPYSTALALQALAKVKPNLLASSISFSKPMPQDAEEVSITATVNNNGLETASNVIVRFYLGDPASNGTQLGIDQIIPSLSPNSSTPISVTASFTGTAQQNDLCGIGTKRLLI